MPENEPQPATKPRQRADWYKQTSAASVGIEMAVAICGGALGGMYLERHVTHWAPWTTMIGLFVGIGAAGLAIARLVREHETEVAARKAEGLALDGSPLDGSPLAPEPNAAATAPAAPAAPAAPDSGAAVETTNAGDDEQDELARLRQRQRAKPLDARGPLP